MSERHQFIQRIEAEISEWEAKLEPLKLEAKLGRMEAGDAFESMKKSIHEKTLHARQRLAEVSRESGEAWKDLVKGCEASSSEAKSAIQAAISRFSK